MTYIYAYSNHKYGLSRLRRMAVHYKALQEQGVEVEMLTNDFRAAAVVRDYGVFACTTIETILDIDYVAQRGDSLIIDSPEEDAGKLELYVEMFSEVIKVANHCNEVSRFGEKILFADPMVDAFYTMQKGKKKVERILFFYGDSDPEKWIEAELDHWADLGIDLLLGEYFYVGYEETLGSAFRTLHEAETYRECIAYSRRVVTADSQCAYEARAAGAEVFYLYDDLESCQRKKLDIRGIQVLKRSDRPVFKALLST